MTDKPKSLCAQIDAICDRLTPGASVAEINLARADLRLLVQSVKAQEITLMALEGFRDEVVRNEEEDLAITLALGPPQPIADVVHLDRFRRVPISEGRMG